MTIALFGGGLFLIFDVPDDPGNGIQDSIMCSVMLFFIVEILLLSLSGEGYLWSFFFWTDILSTLSMVFEISFLLGANGHAASKHGINPMLLRSARAARVGARAARLSRVAKCFAFMTRVRTEHSNVPEYDARVLKARLSQSLSTKVAMLTVVLVMGVPLFQLGRYPEEDFSMEAWGRTLELTYESNYQIAAAASGTADMALFSRTVEEMIAFYDELEYFPFKLEGFSESIKTAKIKGQSLVHRDEPRRIENVRRQEVVECGLERKECNGDIMAAIYFDFKGPHQFAAFMDMATIVFIMVCMIAEAFDLNSTIDTMVVKPVEKMMSTVQLMAKILRTVAPVGPDTTVEEDVDTSTMTEAHLLEHVFKNLLILVADFYREGMVELEDMDTLDHEAKGVILEVMMVDTGVSKNTLATPQGMGFLAMEETVKAVPILPVAEKLMDSWDLDILGMSVENQQKVMLYIFFDSPVGMTTGRVWIDIGTFQRFHEVVRKNYFDNPYHSYTHACDVTASVFRLLGRLKCNEWLRDIDMYALLVSALCHDIGHPGKTTPFLVETMHELALRYNDASPLENMHSAKLFEICRNEGLDVFGQFDREAFKEARKVCINAIIHTDNALHGEMVKAVKQSYEVSSDICDAQSHQDKIGETYLEEVLQKNVVLWQQVILHMCDIATPLKPWLISKAWATRVQDEFFAQGDEEKRLGLPVGMLNDRFKVSRSGAEHGFINFLVAPLALGVVSNFPVLHHLGVQMASNMQSWRDLWVQDTHPSKEEVAKRDADVLRIKDQIETLRLRKGAPTIRVG